MATSARHSLQQAGHESPEQPPTTAATALSLHHGAPHRWHPSACSAWAQTTTSSRRRCAYTCPTEALRALMSARLVRIGVLAHGPRLGVVVRRVGVQVQEVLGRVLPDAQVAHGSRRAAARRPHALLHLPEPCNSNRLCQSDCWTRTSSEVMTADETLRRRCDAAAAT